MNLLRKLVEYGYEKRKEELFRRTDFDPEIAHEEFVSMARLLNKYRLDKLFFNSYENLKSPEFEISNAAGFNKNGVIPPVFLKYLGFDRDIIGTVCADPWGGAPRPRMKRYTETESMVNWMGLPGIGADRVVDNMKAYGKHGVPITVNLMATPGKTGDALLKDLSYTIRTTRDLPNVDRFELNISCPNTHGLSGGIDARREYMKILNDMVVATYQNKYEYQDLYLKISPDLDDEGIENIFDISRGRWVKGFVTTNTSTTHNPRFITSPPNKESKGGASGEAVYELSKIIQEKFIEKIKKAKSNYEIIACGGINSAERAAERTNDSCIKGIQIFTPLIYKGPKLLRDIRKNCW